MLRSQTRTDLRALTNERCHFRNRRSISMKRSTFFSLEIDESKEEEQTPIHKEWFKKNRKPKTLTEFIEKNEDKKKDTSYYRGTKFEFEAVELLEKYNFALTRTGQSLDGGIDFRGIWKLPRVRDDKLKRKQVQTKGFLDSIALKDKNMCDDDAEIERIQVVGQCKKESKMTGAKYLRELEGVLSHQDQDTVGIFFSSSGYTQHAQTHFVQTPYPLVLATFENSFLTQFRLNPIAQKLLPNLVLGHKYVKRTPSGNVKPPLNNFMTRSLAITNNHMSNSDSMKVVLLMYNGKEIGG